MRARRRSPQFSLEQQLQEEPEAELRVLLYRVAQEALTNIRKHAHARRVNVILAEHDGGFLIRITDDGVGFTAPGTLQSGRGHLGLSTMRERAEMAGGWCRLLSLPGAGTTVEIWVPGSAPPPPRHLEGTKATSPPSARLQPSNSRPPMIARRKSDQGIGREPIQMTRHAVRARGVA